MIKGNWYTDGKDQFRFYKKRPDGLLVFDAWQIGNQNLKGKYLIGYPSMERELKAI